MSSMHPSRSLLVYLGNGVQGAAVVHAALRRGFQVRALVRDRRRAQALAALGVELAEGDLRDPASLRAASAGIAHAVLQIPTGPEPAMLAQAGHALAAITACRLRSFVLKLASARLSAPCSEPSFVANAQLEDLAQRTGLPFASVWPTLYLDNLLKPSARADIVDHGVFAPPIAATQAIAWTSAEDCAEAALSLLERGVDGGRHRIAGPESVVGEEFAARLSAALGRRVVYRAQPLEAFEREVDAALGAGSGRQVASKFHFFATHPSQADAILASPFQAQPALQGFRPATIGEWVGRHRQAFGASAGD